MGLFDAIGGLLGIGSGADPYIKTGSASDVVNTNPFTDAFLKSLQGQAGQTQGDLNNILFGNGGVIDTSNLAKTLLGSNANAATNVGYDPNAAINEFLSRTPQLQDIARGSVSPFTADQQLRDLQTQIGQAVSDQFSGNPQSGAFVGAMTQAQAQPLLNLSLNRMQAENTATQNMFGQVGNNLNTNYNLVPSVLLQGLGLANQSASGINDTAGTQLNAGNILASLLGQNLQQQGQIAAPNWWQPTYLNNPDYVSAGNILNLGGQLAGAGISGAAQSSTNALLDQILGRLPKTA